MTYGSSKAQGVPHVREGAAVAVVPATGKAGTGRNLNDPYKLQSPATGLAQMGFVIELPLPPSVNSYVKRLGNASPGVRRWRLLSDQYLYTQWSWLKSRAVKGPFLIDITWTKAEYGKSDIDNRIKPLLDFLQARELIENDKLCREMRVGFGETQYGCRVEVLPRREVQ